MCRECDFVANFDKLYIKIGVKFAPQTQEIREREREAQSESLKVERTESGAKLFSSPSHTLKACLCVCSEQVREREA